MVWPLILDVPEFLAFGPTISGDTVDAILTATTRRFGSELLYWGSQDFGETLSCWQSPDRARSCR
jgi:hypothetical protein